MPVLQHLTPGQYAKLRSVIMEHSATLYVENAGAPVTQLMGDFSFDVELEKDAKPVRHQQPKLSPAQQLLEQAHVRKAEAAGHLRVPRPDQLSG